MAQAILPVALQFGLVVSIIYRTCREPLAAFKDLNYRLRARNCRFGD